MPRDGSPSSPLDRKPSRPLLAEAVKEFLTLSTIHATTVGPRNKDRLCVGIQYERLLYFGTERYFRSVVSILIVYIYKVPLRDCGFNPF